MTSAVRLNKIICNPRYTLCKLMLVNCDPQGLVATSNGGVTMIQMSTVTRSTIDVSRENVASDPTGILIFLIFVFDPPDCWFCDRWQHLKSLQRRCVRHGLHIHSIPRQESRKHVDP